MEIPCVKDCPDRNETCHGSCEKYKAYAVWREEVKKEKREQYALEAAANHRRNWKRAMMHYDEHKKREA